jgi:ABC-type glycerol-3-phosphate transport system substrate-binding protein
MSKQKLYNLLGIVILAAMVLSACGGNAAKSQTSANPAELQVWIEWGDNPAQLQALFDKYTSQSGVKVVVTAPVETDKFLPALTGSEPPDLIIRSGGDLVKSYAKEGLITELSDAIKTGGIDLNDF